MTSPRRGLIKIAEISQQAWRSLAETDPSWVGAVVWEGGGREGCWGQSRSCAEPGLHWKVAEGQGEGGGDQWGGTSCWARVVSHSRGVSRAGSGGPLVLVPSTGDPQLLLSGRQRRTEMGEE